MNPIGRSLLNGIFALYGGAASKRLLSPKTHLHEYRWAKYLYVRLRESGIMYNEITSLQRSNIKFPLPLSKTKKKIDQFSDYQVPE